MTTSERTREIAGMFSTMFCTLPPAFCFEYGAAQRSQLFRTTLRDLRIVVDEQDKAPV